MNTNYLNKEEWVLMNLRLDGSSISRETATKIASGEYALDATLEEHLLITNLVNILPLMETLCGLQEDLSIETLLKFYRVLSDDQNPQYRKTTPILFHLSYNPVLPQEIVSQLTKLFKDIHRDQTLTHHKKAWLIHNNIFRIYPFDKFNEELARCAMEYYLIRHNESMELIAMSEQGYNTYLAEYLREYSKNTQ